MKKIYEKVLKTCKNYEILNIEYPGERQNKILQEFYVLVCFMKNVMNMCCKY